MNGCKLSGNTRLSKKYDLLIQAMAPSLLELKLAKPALRALADKRISHIRNLKRFTPAEVKTWHGIGPNALKKLLPFLKSSFSPK